ncbi:lipopolysaccharide biosynthesis protein [Nocardia stercoris]|uniref:lipopolysaccharide biosynthesis protein n=1 Tax=Nocardia stercoris TaxID=2483361 RepID=UPI001F18CAC3|nr:oligosaccharide flippase family protein [Nocardia stercoris]
MDASGDSDAPRKRKGGKLGVLRDIGLVSFGKYGQYIITLVTQPLIARQLGPHGVGLLAIAISAYFIGSLLVDLGITSFLAAKVEGASPADVGGLRGTYLAIRASTVGVMGLALLAGELAGVSGSVRMILIGLFTGGFWSISEDWLLLGQGRFGASTLYQGIGRVGYLVLLLTVLPRFPTAAVAMGCMFASAIITVSLTWWDALRTYGLPGRPDRLREVLRIGAPVVASRVLVTSYGQGSATVYSSVLDAVSLGLYSTGDRLVRAIQSMLDPIGYALLPRMARNTEQESFWRTSIRFLTAVVTIAVLAVIAVWISAPLLIHVMFGPQFASAVPMLRLEVIILPATAITSFATTAVLSVRQDTIGVLVGAIIGTCVAATALGFTALATHSVWTLVYGTVAAELSVAMWYIIRMRWLVLREKAVRGRAGTDVPGSGEGAQS